ncbi:ABC transporter-like protein [Macrophomina phaseolina MS6]|uniref:ABC transporter-like protein n=1 Tax=Macrophomina phaseolina (strain MS6) TaxID=1126212 RepID=K2R638_MACPH|nr:ABC transporter-like protein [Macrophomina phaseolina MS6]
MQSTIDHSVKAAKRAGDDKKLRQAASRKKKLDERMGMEVSAKGTRFKLSRDHAGFHSSRRGDIDIPTFDSPPRIAFPLSPADLRFPGALFSLEKVSFAYEGGNRPTTILTDINLTIHPGERVGIAGLNGSGKSTLLSLIMGQNEAGSSPFNPTKGDISRHSRARFGRYSQRAVAELTAVGLSEPHSTSLTHLMQTVDDISEGDARGLLASIGLPGRVASDVPLSKLSGGQKVRLALAKLLWMPPQLLILDEVSTHLDSDTILALAIALRRYEGAILLVTHDRFFMRCVVQGESPKRILETVDEDERETSDDSDEELGFGIQGVVYRLSKGKLTKLEGGMQQYEELAEKASAKLGKV